MTSDPTKHEAGGGGEEHAGDLERDDERDGERDPVGNRERDPVGNGERDQAAWRQRLRQWAERRRERGTAQRRDGEGAGIDGGMGAEDEAAGAATRSTAPGRRAGAAVPTDGPLAELAALLDDSAGAPAEPAGAEVLRGDVGRAVLIALAEGGVRSRALRLALVPHLVYLARRGAWDDIVDELTGTVLLTQARRIARAIAGRLGIDFAVEPAAATAAALPAPEPDER